MKRLRALWQSTLGDSDRRIRQGRIVGLTFIAAGFVMIFLAWNGAASQWRSDSQFPYLLSGGIGGLALIIVGVTLLILSIIRAERQSLTDKVDSMISLLSRNLARMQYTTNGSSAGTAQVVVAAGHYHLTDCTVLEGKTGLSTLTIEQAAAEGVGPCRVCEPPPPPERVEEKVSAGNGTQGQ